LKPCILQGFFLSQTFPEVHFKEKVQVKKRKTRRGFNFTCLVSLVWDHEVERNNPCLKQHCRLFLESNAFSPQVKIKALHFAGLFFIPDFSVLK
jgi:hypothetical protein